ncbi:MAG TPA: ABC transporter ATP-binding protein [Candidatus Limnocylindria bacterium]|nr:ABC transporter ATP-binding protein [Candidatus Limnocylindria bacterium]
MTLLALERATRRFGTGAAAITAVDDVSLAVDRGEALCIVGESGCGKTTTGKMLAGLLRPSAGRLLFEGQDVWGGPRELFARFRRSVQLVHQDPYASLNPTRTVLQTLETPILRHRTRDRRVARATALELLEMVGLTPAPDMAAKYPHQLSGGQRQRVAIARALTVEPRAIVADEAVSMVDVSIRISLLDLLHGLATEFGVATVLITHDLAVARYFGREGRVAVMYLGRVVELAATEALVEDPAHPYTAALVGAVPEADPEITRGKTRVKLRSAEAPSLSALPSGCSFHPRCPLMEPGLCDVQVPELLPLPGTRDVACHVAVRERTPAAELLGAR